MAIYGPAHVHGPQPIGPPHTSRLPKPAAPSRPDQIQDELEISDVGRTVEQIKQLPDVRQGRVDEIRAQIAAGTYETEEKLQIALERLLDEIA
jgi:negative regulator of flagellin synthesis FlgM